MRNWLRVLALVGLISVSLNSAWAQDRVKWQNKDQHLIQFSGIVVEGDSLRPVPYTSIIVNKSNRGTISDYFG